MKRHDGKNIPKWLVPTLCLAVLLLIAGIAAMLLLPGQKQQQELTGSDGKLYWNVERDIYKTGTYVHRNVGDDLYRLLFAVDGEQVQLDVKGMTLVNYIDTMDLMGLVFDENGIVVDAKAVPECTGGYAAFEYYVESVDGNTVTANNNYVFKGHSKTLEITENTGIYNVGETGPLCGLPGVVSYNDTIIAVQDLEGNVTHIFTKPYKKPGDVYWNVDKLYDSVNKISTRQPNDLMLYEIDFILNGEAITLRCKDPEVVNQIDSARIMGLEFDENGYIIGFKTVRQVANGGRAAATNYYVSNLDYKGGQLQVRNTAVVADASTVASFFPTEDMVVYDMSGNDGTKGKQTQLQLHDRVIFILDSHSMITQVFVTSRKDDSPLYWNVDRDWNKTTKSTNRKPDKDGWYYFKMAANGAHVTVKTNQLSIANAIESPVNIGLRLDGNVVVETLSATKIHPGGVYASYLYIKEIRQDGTIVAERTTDGVTTTKIAKVADNCEYYNVSATSVLEGEKISFSDLKVGDTVHGYKDFNGDISILYVVGSVSESPIYWNVDKVRYWDSKNEVSTRTPDENGYYNILFAVNGEQVTLKTRDKKMVNDIDNRTCMGLRLSGSTIVKVYGAIQTVNTKGGLFASSYHVTAINGNTITATKLSGTDEGKSVKATMAYNCQVYDVSNTAKLVGQVSGVRVGDQIRGLLNDSKQISVLYVLTASNHKENHKCDCCGETPLWLAWDGSSTITKSGHYVLSDDITAAHGIKWTPDLEVTLCLNGHTLTVDDRRVFGNTTGTLNLVDCAGTGCVHGTVNNNASITMVDGGTVNIYGGTYTANEITEVKNGGLFTIIGGGKLNMYGGTVTGGKTNGYGGNINISDGTFTLNGGEVSKGTSAQGQYGGNIALSGDQAVMIMNGGKIANGTSGSHGGNIAVAKAGARLEIIGGVIENGTAATHGGNITVAMGTVTLANCQINGGIAPNYGSSISAVNDSSVTIHDAAITGGQLRMSNTGGLTLGGKLTIEWLHLHNNQLTVSEQHPLQDARIAVSMNIRGVFCENASEEHKAFFTSYDPDLVVYHENDTLFLDSNNIHRHCDCGGVGEHTCDDSIRWTAYTQDLTLEDGGHYYLTDNILDNISIAENATVHLCLNGYEISSNARVFGNISSGKTLNVHDCRQTGKVHGMTNNNASVAMVNGGVLNIYGGTITANPITETNKNGGILLAMNEGVINLYNGVITGGNTTGVGGCVYLTNQAQFNMYGGTISEGTSAKNGGTVAIAGNAVLTVVGGNIGMGTATGELSCVYHNSAQPVIVGGDAHIADIYLESASTMACSETYPLDLDDGDDRKAVIGFTKESSGLLIDGIEETYIRCFTNMGRGTMAWDNGILTLILPHSHCVCVGAEVKPADHVCSGDQEWTAVTASKTIDDNGYYYLDFTAKPAAITVADGVHAHLCLNGARIYAMSTITLGEGSTLDICDCSENQSGIIGLSGGATRGPVLLDGEKTINLYSGTITGQMNSNKKQTVVISSTKARFNMYGGKLTKGVSTSNGGNVQVESGQFHMYGGQITGGESTTYGGNVALTGSNASFFLYDGQITGGTATTHGGNICVSYGRLEVTGGQISDGNATTNGGNISFVNGGYGVLTGGQITGGTAGGKGSCIYNNSKNVTVGGDVQISEILVNGGNNAVTVSADKPLSGTTPIPINVASLPTGYTTVVKNCTELSFFSWVLEGYELQTSGENIILRKL